MDPTAESRELRFDPRQPSNNLVFQPDTCHRPLRSGSPANSLNPTTTSLPLPSDHVLKIPTSPLTSSSHPNSTNQVFPITHNLLTMSLNISVSIPLPIARSIHKSSDPETGNLAPSTQTNILRSIVSAVKSLPDDSSTWPKNDDETEAGDERSTTPPETEIRVSFSDTDTYIPRRKSSFRHRRGSSSAAKDTVAHVPAIALQKPSGPDISFPGAQFAFEVRQSGGSGRSLAIAAHGSVTTSELAMAIWKREGIPMREQRLYLGHEEIYNGRAHERDGVYEMMHLRGKFRHVGQGSVVVLVVGQGKRSPRVG